MVLHTVNRFAFGRLSKCFSRTREKVCSYKAATIRLVFLVVPSRFVREGFLCLIECGMRSKRYSLQASFCVARYPLVLLTPAHKTNASLRGTAAIGAKAFA
jgi:hypothetical protein